MKAAGALFIVAGCTWYGVIKAAGLCRRERTLAAFLETLRFISAELSNSASPLPELFLRLSKTARPELRPFFAGLSESMDSIGERSLSSLWQERLMSDESLELSQFQRLELCRPGLMLGRYDAQEQITALESCVSRLEPELREQARRAREGKRLYTGLGLIGGIMAATVIL